MKKELNIENIKKIYKKRIFWLVFTLLLFSLYPFIALIFQSRFSEESVLLIFFIIVCFLLLLAIIFSLIEQKKQIKNIKIGNFIIAEDQIYDKREGIDSEAASSYYIFTKIYGEIHVDSSTYRNSFPNDMVYLWFNSKNISLQKFESDINEYKEYRRNSKQINHVFLASQYEVGSDFLPYLVPYDVDLGENNYNIRVKQRIKKLEKDKKVVKCKQCSKRYNRLKYNECPKCGTVFKFDATDVLHQTRDF